jgi:hypothetical protein
LMVMGFRRKNAGVGASSAQQREARPRRPEP